MYITKGISKLQTNQLIIYSKSDPEILKFTRDKKRFSSPVKFKKWSKSRVIYTLTDNGENLLGIIWFGLKDKYVSFAIRVYPPARGKGHAKKFMADVLKAFQYSQEYENMKRLPIVLETQKDNITAINLYKKTSWKTCGEKDNRLLFSYSLPGPE